MRKSYSAILLLIFAAAPALAAPYFDTSLIDPTLLTPPPPPTSQEWKVEQDYIEGLQKNAPPEEVQKAAHERDFKPELLAADVFPQLTREKYPALYHLLDRVGDTTHAAADTAKEYWKTDRPYMADPNIKPLIEAHKSPGYPSGHTASAYALARVLSLLMPDHRAEFWKRAKEVAEHRVLVGMHFPHDLAGGREESLLVVGALLQNPDFAGDFMKARQELHQKPVKP